LVVGSSGVVVKGEFQRFIASNENLKILVKSSTVAAFRLYSLSDTG